MKYYYDWLSMLILCTTGIPLLLLQSKYCNIHWHQVPGISPLSYLWAAASHFNSCLLDGSISCILVYLPYLGWYYRQYHIQLLYTYISPFPIFSNSLLIDTFFTTSFHNEFSFSKLVYSPQWGLISIINFWVLISD